MSLGDLDNSGWGRRPSFGQSVVRLVGHAVGGAFLFAALACLSWGLGYGVAMLHRIHPFSESVLLALHGVEVAILYLDIGLSGIVLFVGAVRFVREISGSRP